MKGESLKREALILLQLVNAELTSHQSLSPANTKLTLDCPEIARIAKPGQFVMVRSGEGTDPFLRRAISISDVQNDALSLVVQNVGMGTKAIQALKPGATISILGPLGKGFDLAIADAHVLLIAGGVGIAPFPFLARRLPKSNKISVIVGGRDASAVMGLASLFDDLDVTWQVVTEDGSVGEKGLVTTHLPKLSGVNRMYTCGPNPMLAAVKDIAETANVPCQLSLEGKMACGVGVCLGCTCKGKTDAEPYAKVCTDGPVFWSEEVRLS